MDKLDYIYEEVSIGIPTVSYFDSMPNEITYNIEDIKISYSSAGVLKVEGLDNITPQFACGLMDLLDFRLKQTIDNAKNNWYYERIY